MENFKNDKIIKINETTKLANLNMLNKVNEQIDFAVDVLKNQKIYSLKCCKTIFWKCFKEKSMTTIKKLYKKC